MPMPYAPLGFLTLLAALLKGSQRGGGGLTEPMPPPGVLDQPVPFPQAPASDLPPFPSGWEYFQPPPHAVVVRAWQLLQSLWARGEGSITQEQTAGVWVTYRAEKMAGGVKGVTAWRVKPGATSRQAPSNGKQPVPGARPPLPTIPASYTQPPTGPTPSPLGGSMTPAQIQAALNAAGANPPLTVDGKLGPLSKQAVVNFQNAHSLVADGIPGPLTQRALAPYLAATAPSAPIPVTLPPLPASYPQPRAAPAPAALSPIQIQAALNAAGTMPPLVTDGVLGPKSVVAIRLFQGRHPPLVVDGKAGPLTQTALAPYLGMMA